MIFSKKNEGTIVYRNGSGLDLACFSRLKKGNFNPPGVSPDIISWSKGLRAVMISLTCAARGKERISGGDKTRGAVWTASQKFRQGWFSNDEGDFLIPGAPVDGGGFPQDLGTNLNLEGHL